MSGYTAPKTLSQKIHAILEASRIPITSFKIHDQLPDVEHSRVTMALRGMKGVTFTEHRKWCLEGFENAVMYSTKQKKDVALRLELNERLDLHDKLDKINIERKIVMDLLKKRRNFDIRQRTGCSENAIKKLGVKVKAERAAL